MRWTIEGDATRTVITAQEHVRSAHGGEQLRLPEKCVLFEMGMALPFMRNNYDTIALSERLPCFIAESQCLRLRDRQDVCFVSGGYGAPAAADTLETLRVLGVQKVLVVGMCGGFGGDIAVGDVVVPHMILREEGTSFHYANGPEFACPDSALHEHAAQHFAAAHRTLTDATVTCDAFYRQTFAKEALWRAKGCVAVDMEASALLAVAAFYGMQAAAVLICSDRHPENEDDPRWKWGSEDFRAKRQDFVSNAVKLALSM